MEAYAFRKYLSLSLDIEGFDKRRKDFFFDCSKKEIAKLEKDLGALEVKKNWLKGGSWARIAHEISQPVYDEDLVRKSTEILCKMYDSLLPPIQRFASKKSLN